MYESLKYYVLRAWKLGLSGDEAIKYICESAGVSEKIAHEVVDKLVAELSE